jgi:transcriptional regulator with XRE-family HTH domain
MRADDHTGERIRERRLALGLSQRDIDSATSFSYAYISRIEAGERTPSLSALIEFGDVLGRLRALARHRPDDRLPAVRTLGRERVGGTGAPTGALAVGTRSVHTSA